MWLIEVAILFLILASNMIMTELAFDEASKTILLSIQR